jgi:hypothetical protein
LRSRVAPSRRLCSRCSPTGSTVNTLTVQGGKRNPIRVQPPDHAVAPSSVTTVDSTIDSDYPRSYAQIASSAIRSLERLDAGARSLPLFA